MAFEEHELGGDPRWDCGDPDRAAIEVEPDPGVGAYQVTIQHGRHVRSEVVRAKYLGDLATGCGDFSVEAGTEYCVELRAITANGHAGPPAAACTTAVFVPRKIAPEPPAPIVTVPAVEAENVPPLLAAESTTPGWLLGMLAGLGVLVAIVLGQRLVRPRNAR